MKLWITKPWSPLQLGVLKLSCGVFGVAVGANFASCLRPQVLWMLIAAILLAVWPTMHYFGREQT